MWNAFWNGREPDGQDLVERFAVDGLHTKGERRVRKAANHRDRPDEFTLTIAPVLLGAGKRLFDGISRTDITFERTAVIESPFATHLRFRVGLGDESVCGENAAAADLQTS